MMVWLWLAGGCVQGHTASARPDAGAAPPHHQDADEHEPDATRPHDAGANDAATEPSSPSTGVGSAERDGAAESEPKAPFDAGSDPDRNAVEVGTICDRLSTLQCAAEAACCDAPKRTQAECKRAMKASCDMDSMADAVAARAEAAFDAARAEQVFAELERMMSACDPDVIAYGAARDGLSSLFAGSVAADGDCTPDSLLNTVQGGAALVACRERDTQACLPTVGRWTCTMRAAVGGHCFSDENCEPDAYCDNPMLNVRGSTCKPHEADGSACTVTTECESLFCKDGECVTPDVQLAYCLLEES
jgi:hypothetical protein